MFSYIPDSNSPVHRIDRTVCGYSFSREDEGPCPFFKGMTQPCFRAVVQANAIVLKNKHCLHTFTNVLRF